MLLYNYSPIYNHLCSSGEQPSSALWFLALGKHQLSAHLLSTHLRSRPGKAPTFRAPLSRPKSTPPSATGFREPPYKPAWLRETPYATIGVFPVVSGCLLLITQLGRVSPYGYEASPPQSGLWQLRYAACRNRPTNHCITT